MSGFFSSIKRATSASFDGQGCSGDPEGGGEMRFSMQPAPGESGFSQWSAAMKMVAQLPGGIPAEFRGRLWLTLAERHLAARGVDWPRVERTCFSEWSHPADAELGVQIVKDLHRTGCSLFCGEDGQENQALLKRVLLAYARWNKAVGYCQGFNMLAALILQVTDKCESDALKLMIYLIEGVLPDSYFADSLRGLSVDMAVFRELLRSRLPRLSRHLDALQNAAKDGSRSYEPPLTNVFTMQWFLTLFCNCLPQPTVLRVWDLILLEGNEILLRTALAIWQVLADKILGVRSADEFYCIMGVLTRELLEFGLVDGNSLIKAVIAIGPLTELKSLREHYLYNINPWGPSLPQAVVEKQLKLYTRQSIALDISALKKQYTKLKQRQRQAHIIFSAAISRQSPPAAPVTMNHLLLGKSALVPAKRLGPPKGTIPPARQAPSTLLWKDTPKQTSSSSSSDTELCDDDDEGQSSSDGEPERKSQFDDNLPPDRDTILMRTDNTTSAKTSASEPEQPVDVADTDPLEAAVGRSSPPGQGLPTEDPEISETSDTFDTASYTVKVQSESDEENFDFEQFLADRVKCLKEDDVAQEEESDEKISYTRRNSAKALQIIQENSLILHRILQCQTRLSPSPSPPPILEEDKMKPSGDNLHPVMLPEHPQSHSKQDGLLSPDLSYEPRSEIDTTTYPDRLTQILFQENAEELKSPEYGSKYTSILEKSKSLDERYNALILNIPPLKQSVSEQRSITSICEENKLNSSPQGQFFKLDDDFSVENILSQNYNDTYDVASSLKHTSVEVQSNKSPESVSPKPDFKDFDPISPEKFDFSTKFNLYPETKSAGYQSYKDFSYKFPIATEKDDEQTTSDLSSFSWKETSDDNISTFNLGAFTTSTINEVDSGISLAKPSSFDINPPPRDSPKYLLTDTNEFKFTGNETTSKHSYTLSEEENQESERHSSFYKDLMQLQDYSQSLPDKTIIRDSSLSDNRKDPQGYNFESQNELEEPFGHSTKHANSSDESNRKPFTLNVSSQGESSSSKSPLKSPSKAFNPFPVPLSSRQSKEVPLKLGLYKK